MRSNSDLDVAIDILSELKDVLTSLKDKDLSSPLHFALQYNCTKEIIELLINKGSDINAKNKDLLTPLHVAIGCHCEKEIIELLINKGSDVNAKADNLSTPLHIAIQYKCTKEIIELLINKGSDVNAKDKNLLTPLHFAICFEIENNIIELFIKNGAKSISLFPHNFFHKKEYSKDFVTYIINNNKMFHINLETTIRCGFNIENIKLLLTKKININIPELSKLILESNNHEQLKELFKSYKGLKFFFLKDDLKNEEEINLFTSLHNNHVIKRISTKENAIFRIIENEKDGDRESVKKKYDIDIPKKGKNRDGFSPN